MRSKSHAPATISASDSLAHSRASSRRSDSTLTFPPPRTSRSSVSGSLSGELRRRILRHAPRRRARAYDGRRGEGEDGEAFPCVKRSNQRDGCRVNGCTHRLRTNDHTMKPRLSTALLALAISAQHALSRAVLTGRSGRGRSARPTPKKPGCSRNGQRTGRLSRGRSKRWAVATARRPLPPVASTE